MFNEIVRDDVNHTGLASCLCSACAGDIDPRLLDSSGDTAVDASLDPRAGGTLNNKPIWTVEQVAAHLNRTGGGFANGFGNEANNGRQNNIGDGADTITFGFFNTQAQVISNGYTYVAPNANGVNTLYGLNEVFNFAAFSEAQRSATREAMQGWDDVVAVSFKEVGADDADMNFGNLASAPTTQAYARIPTAALDATLGGQVREIGGDTWISASQASNFQLDEGGYGLQTLAHEIGHSIGLSHPGGYNAAPGLSITYAANAEYAQDTRAYSIMSYFQGSSIAGTRHFDFNISTTVYAGTPLIHDIAAAQAIYGADMTTRTGDTVYGFNTNTGRDAFDFTKTPASIMAIWDAGGNDTIDASGYATTQLIDLTPGSLSSIGGVTFDTAPSFEQVNLNRAAAGFGPIARATYDANMAALKANPEVGRLTDNVGIAYGTTIENAIGGSGDDTFIANAAANKLAGNAGVDLVSYRSSTAGVTVSLLTLSGLGGFAQGDTFSGIEGFEGSQFADALTGDAGANTLIGLAGDDRLVGGAGDDLLIGGAGKDVQDGGAGFDTVSYRDAAAGVTLTVTNNGVTASGDAAGDSFFSIEAFEGGAFADIMNGGNLNDLFSGLGGNDRLSGANGADTLNGGDGDDLLDGGNDNDTLNGGAGNDDLDGGNGVDTLNGGAGDDVLKGGLGNDVLNGGAGSDRLTGGTGNDIFRFTDAGGTDTLTDFRSGQDKIDLSGFFGVDAGDLKFDQNQIFIDINNDGITDFTIVTTGVTITQVDILFGG